MESNVQKMREALEKAKQVIHCAIVMGMIRGESVNEAYLSIRDVLSAPPRNCDVGTVEEQEERFARYCIVQTCGTCPCFVKLTNGDWRCNPFAWAQMPYEAEGAGE